MGLTYTNIILSNPMEVKSLVDTGSNFLCIPQHILNQLKLKVDDTKKVDYVGPIKINFQNQQCYTRTLVFREKVLLGSIPMRDMNLVTNSTELKITVNPKNPNMAVAIVM